MASLRTAEWADNPEYEGIGLFSRRVWGIMEGAMQPFAPPLTKADLRRSIREQLRGVEAGELAAWSARLVAWLKSAEGCWAGGGTVALFGGLRNEPDLLTGFTPWLRERGWRTVLFAVVGVELVPHEVRTVAEMKRGPLGVWEPVQTAAVPLHELTLILVPGLAFAASDGARLGRGGGYYDRLLARPEVRARRIGVAFEVQVLTTVPREEHDACVPELVTERGWRRICLT